MLEPLYTSEEMRAAEERYPGYPDSVPELMERAGKGVADLILEFFGDAKDITVVCGSGNNGGDGKVAARHLQEAGRDVRVVEVKPEDEEKDLGSPDLIVDAIFGTGFAGEPRSGTARLIEEINDLDVEVVAVDVPSGVDASTGEVAGGAIDAWSTVTFHGEKVGTMVAPGSFKAGWTEVVGIGLEPVETAQPTSCSRCRGAGPTSRRRSTRPGPCSSWAARRGCRGPPAWPPRPLSGPTRAMSPSRRRPSPSR